MLFDVVVAFLQQKIWQIAPVFDAIALVGGTFANTKFAVDSAQQIIAPDRTRGFAQVWAKS